jgi:FkbM family methyltransferase
MPECAAHDAKLIFAGEYDIPLKRPPATVLDIGANVGLFSVWAAQKWPDARIEAYEPWPENCRDLEENVAPLCGRVAVRDVGVEGIGCEGRVMRKGINRMRCSTGNKDGEAVRVAMRNASRIPSAEFVKIDTEGAEVEILTGLDLSKTRAIAVEAHSKELAGEVAGILVERGFAQYSRAPTVNGCSLLKFVRPLEELGPPASAPHTPASPVKLWVALPVYGGYHPFFIAPLLNLVLSPPCNLTVRQCAGDSLVARARNKLAAEFLASDCTHLLFLDTDLIFTNEQIARLLSHDEMIVAGLYPKKQPTLAWVCNVLDEPTEPDERGLQRIKYAGTGCLMVKREVFERMIQAHPELAYEADDGDKHGTRFDFFSCGVHVGKDGRRRYLSEDWWFCQRALDLGIPVHADVHVVLKHVGDCVYPLQNPFVEAKPA